MPESRTYRPVEGRESMRLSQSLADRDEPFTVASWPQTTEDAGEQAALDAHPWVVAEADEQPAQAPQQSASPRRSTQPQAAAEASTESIDTEEASQ